MKKLLFTFVALALLNAAFSQQPENPGFETWENVGLNEDEPVDWSSIKTSDNSTLNGFAPYVWEKSTDSHSGTYSVKLFNVSTWGIVATGTITNGRVHSDLNPDNAYVYTDVNDNHWNTPLTKKPDSVVVWARFNKQGNDTAALKALLHTGSAHIPDPTYTNWVSIAQINIPNQTNTWTRFSAPFTYLNGDTPEYILFVLSAGGASSTEGSEVWFDDVELIYNPVVLDITVFMQGPYSGGEMSTNLNPEYIPLTQPYNTAPWNYNGSENVAFVPQNAVDWVLVEVRDATDANNATGSTIVGRQAGFLMKDGSVKGLDGTERLSFDIIPDNNIFVVVWHRNHLGVMSAFPLTKINGIYSYDFTDSADKSFGGESGIVQLNVFGPDVWGMAGGDSNGDGTINTFDKVHFWKLVTGKSGYLTSDYNLNGQINNPDKNDIWVPNKDKQCQVPN